MVCFSKCRGKVGQIFSWKPMGISVFQINLMNHSDDDFVLLPHIADSLLLKSSSWYFIFSKWMLCQLTPLNTCWSTMLINSVLQYKKLIQLYCNLKFGQNFQLLWIKNTVYYRPPTKLWEGNVLSCVSLFMWPLSMMIGSHHWPGVPITHDALDLTAEEHPLQTGNLFKLEDTLPLLLTSGGY